MTNTEATIQQLRDENRKLQQRLAVLEQQAATNALEQANLSGHSEDLAAVLYNIPFPVCLLRGPEHIITVVNPPFVHMLGDLDVVGKTMREALPMVEGHGIFELLDQVYATGEPVRIDEYHYGLSAEEQEHEDQPVDLWFTLIYQPIRDNTGAIVGVLTLTLEVTAQVHARRELEQREAEVRERETLQRTVLNAIPDLVLRNDREGYFRDAYPAGSFATYVPPEMFLHKQYHEVLPPGIASLFDETHRHILATGIEQTFTYQMPDDPRIYEARMVAGGLDDTITLVRDLTQQQTQEQELRTFKALVEHAPVGVGFSATDGVISYANAALRTGTGYGDALVGQHFSTMYPEESQSFINAAMAEVAQKGMWQGKMFWQHKAGHTVPIQVTVFAIFNAANEPEIFAAIMIDISRQEQAEQERVILQQQVIDAQQAAIRELSTPLIPLIEGVLVMPLIGTIDSQRAQQVLEALLEGVAAHRASIVILDITGVQMVDTQVANAFITTAQAVRLLGAQVMITGIQPAIAQTLVQLGTNLGDIITYSTLQTGIAAVLRRAYA